LPVGGDPVQRQFRATSLTSLSRDRSLYTADSFTQHGPAADIIRAPDGVRATAPRAACDTWAYTSRPVGPQQFTGGSVRSFVAPLRKAATMSSRYHHDIAMRPGWLGQSSCPQPLQSLPHASALISHSQCLDPHCQAVHSLPLPSVTSIVPPLPQVDVTVKHWPSSSVDCMSHCPITANDSPACRQVTFNEARVCYAPTANGSGVSYPITNNIPAAAALLPHHTTTAQIAPNMSYYHHYLSPTKTAFRDTTTSQVCPPPRDVTMSHNTVYRHGLSPRRVGQYVQSYGQWADGGGYKPVVADDALYAAYHSVTTQTAYFIPSSSKQSSHIPLHSHIPRPSLAEQRLHREVVDYWPKQVTPGNSQLFPHSSESGTLLQLLQDDSEMELVSAAGSTNQSGATWNVTWSDSGMSMEPVSVAMDGSGNSPDSCSRVAGTAMADREEETDILAKATERLFSPGGDEEEDEDEEADATQRLFGTRDCLCEDETCQWQHNDQSAVYYEPAVYVSSVTGDLCVSQSSQELSASVAQSDAEQFTGDVALQRNEDVTVDRVSNLIVSSLNVVAVDDDTTARSQIDDVSAEGIDVNNTTEQQVELHDDTKAQCLPQTPMVLDVNCSDSNDMSGTMSHSCHTVNSVCHTVGSGDTISYKITFAESELYNMVDKIDRMNFSAQQTVLGKRQRYSVERNAAATAKKCRQLSAFSSEFNSSADEGVVYHVTETSFGSEQVTGDNRQLKDCHAYTMVTDCTTELSTVHLDDCNIDNNSSSLLICSEKHENTNNDSHIEGNCKFDTNRYSATIDFVTTTQQTLHYMTTSGSNSVTPSQPILLVTATTDCMTTACNYSVMSTQPTHHATTATQLTLHSVETSGSNFATPAQPTLPVTDTISNSITPPQLTCPVTTTTSNSTMQPQPTHPVTNTAQSTMHSVAASSNKSLTSTEPTYPMTTTTEAVKTTGRNSVIPAQPTHPVTTTTQPTLCCVTATASNFVMPTQSTSLETTTTHSETTTTSMPLTHHVTTTNGNSITPAQLIQPMTTIRDSVTTTGRKSVMSSQPTHPVTTTTQLAVCSVTTSCNNSVMTAQPTSFETTTTSMPLTHRVTTTTGNSVTPTQLIQPMTTIIDSVATTGCKSVMSSQPTHPVTTTTQLAVCSVTTTCNNSVMTAQPTSLETTTTNSETTTTSTPLAHRVTSTNGNSVTAAQLIQPMTTIIDSVTTTGRKSVMSSQPTHPMTTTAQLTLHSVTTTGSNFVAPAQQTSLETTATHSETTTTSMPLAHRVTTTTGNSVTAAQLIEPMTTIIDSVTTTGCKSVMSSQPTHPVTTATQLALHSVTMAGSNSVAPAQPTHCVMITTHSVTTTARNSVTSMQLTQPVTAITCNFVTPTQPMTTTTDCVTASGHNSVISVPLTHPATTTSCNSVMPTQPTQPVRTTTQPTLQCVTTTDNKSVTLGSSVTPTHPVTTTTQPTVQAVAATGSNSVKPAWPAHSVTAATQLTHAVTAVTGNSVTSSQSTFTVTATTPLRVCSVKLTNLPAITIKSTFPASCTSSMPSTPTMVVTTTTQARHSKNGLLCYSGKVDYLPDPHQNQQETVGQRNCFDFLIGLTSQHPNC